MKLDNFRDLANGIGVACGYLLVFAVCAIPEGTKSGVLLVIAIVVAGALFRRKVRLKTRKLFSKGLSGRSLRTQAYLWTLGSVILFPVVTGVLVGAANDAKAGALMAGVSLFVVLIAAAIGFGAAKGEEKRCIERASPEPPSLEKEGWFWAYVGAVFILMMSVGFYGYYRALALIHRQHSPGLQSVAIAADKMAQERQQSAAQLTAQLDKQGDISNSPADRAARDASQQAIVEGITDPRYRAIATAIQRVGKTLSVSAQVVTDAVTAVSKDGGVFKPANLATHEAIVSRLRLVAEAENCYTAYNDRLGNVRASLSREIAGAGATPEATPTTVDSAYQTMQVDALLELCDNGQKMLRVDEDVLHLLDRTLGTRQLDETGRPLFAADEDVAAYNAALKKHHALEQDREVILRRIADAMSKGANKP